MKKVRIKLKRGLAGKREKHVRTVKALGLRKPNQVIEKELTPQIEGMIRSVSYLLEVEEVK